MPRSKKKKVAPRIQTKSLLLDIRRYAVSLILGLGLFVLAYYYTSGLNIPGPLNKSIADVAIVLVGSSMLLTAICYFWDFLDPAIIYRKYLGMMGFAFAIVHILLSWDAFLSFFNWELWLSGQVKAAAAGMFATIIFTIMAIISNNFSTKLLGGKLWRQILRSGYLGVILVFLHVLWLKSKYWIRWWEGGMERPPSSSLIVSIFMVIVVLSRIALEISLRMKKSTRKKK